MKGLDTGAPIDVDAARIEIQDAANQAVFSGDVVIRQGKLTLNADTVKVLYTRDKAGNPRCSGSMRAAMSSWCRPANAPPATPASMMSTSKIITLTGNVTLDRGGSNLAGQRLVLNLVSGQTSFDGRGGGTAASPGTSPGRVTGTFTVPQRTTPKP